MPRGSDYPLSDLLRAFPLTPAERDAFSIVSVPIPIDFDIEALEEMCVRISAGSVRDIGEIADEFVGLWGELKQ